MKFVLQWHLTEKCNYRCKHCYHHEYLHEGPSLEDLKNIFFDYLEIKKNAFGDTFDKRIINFIGGEVFLREDFLDFLEFINENIDFTLYVGILTNGSTLDQKKLDFLKTLKNIIFRVQISVEGTRIANDNIRGAGTFDTAMRAVKLCYKNGISTHLSLTLTKLNKEEVFNLIPYLEEYNITLRIRRIVPMGFGEQLKDYLLTPEEWYKFSIKVHKANFLLKNGFLDLSSCSEVTSYKYNTEGCAINYHRLLVINHDLEVYPCKRLEISLGNLKNEKLKDVFFSKYYMDLLTTHEDIEVCKSCSLYNSCKGGAKCVTHAVTGGLKEPDPQCLKAEILNDKKDVSKT